MRTPFLFFCLTALSMAACSDDVSSLIPDATVDVTTDGVSDDTTVDVAGDGSSDITEDGSADVMPDTGEDTIGQPDATEDAVSDADDSGVDAEPDAVEDTAPDVSEDAQVDLGPDLTAPSVRSITPADGESVSPLRNITVFFDEAVDTSTLTLGGSMADEAGELIWSETTVADDTLTIRPDPFWTTGDGATLEVTVADLAGNTGETFAVTYNLRCSSNGDCLEPERCVEGLCMVTPCEEASVCAGFDGCVDGFCGSCRTSDDCEATEECSRTQCLPLPRCDDAGDCAEGLICSDSLCESCTTNDQCATAYGASNGCGGGECAGLASAFCAAFGQTCDAGEGCSRRAANDYVCEFNGCGATQIFDGSGCTDIGIL